MSNYASRSNRSWLHVKITRKVNSCARANFYGDLMSSISKKRSCKYPNNLKRSLSFFSNFSTVEVLSNPTSKNLRVKTNDLQAIMSKRDYSHSMIVDITSGQTECTRYMRETRLRRPTESVGSRKLMWMGPFQLANNREYRVAFIDGEEQHFLSWCSIILRILQDKFALRPLIIIYDKQVIGWDRSLCDCHSIQPKNPSSGVLPSCTMYLNDNKAIKEPTNDLPKDMVYDNDARNLHF